MKPVRIIGLSAFAVVIITLLGSCGSRTEEKRLSDIESYIDSRPDSALAAIRAIDTTALRGRAVKAKYSLLHAIALDKNYIDTADTRIVQPAVDWYSRHGSPEEKLKAWMYLGTEQFNGSLFNNAIVSYSLAVESAPLIGDQNLLGILYSKMADTFTKTFDYAQASDYIDKSLDCFRRCGRVDQEKLELLRKAGNLCQIRKWEEADSCFNTLLRDRSINGYIRERAMIEYALFLLSLRIPDESKAMEYFSKALEDGAKFENVSEQYAYAYLLCARGDNDEADSIWGRGAPAGGMDLYSYYYWRHRENLRQGDYYNAYHNLWYAMSARDSIIKKRFEVSASDSQRYFLERSVDNQTVMIHNQRQQVIIITLLCLALLFLSIIMYLLYQRVTHRRQEEQERFNIVIENLRNQVAKNERSNKRKAMFEFLANVYEETYRNVGDEDTSDNLVRVLKKKIGNLRTDPKAQEDFERMVDKEMDGIMTKFRNDCPSLNDSEYRMASYYFAGFDNTTVMIIMGISSLENTRSRKRFLRKKISEKYGLLGDHYASIIGGRT